MFIVKKDQDNLSTTSQFERYGKMRTIMHLRTIFRSNGTLSSFIFSGICILSILFSLNTPTCFALPHQAMEQEQLVTIDKKDQTFVEALNSLAEQSGIEIVFNGTQPTMKRDILINYLCLGRAISHIIRLYDVKNNAMIYNKKNARLFQVVIHSYKSVQGEKGVSSEPKRNPSENHLSLTLAQMNQLYEQNAQIKENFENSSKPLSADQMALLREKSKRLESDEKKGTEPLTQEQLKQLTDRNNSNKLTEDNDQGQPLTAEQMHKLNERNHTQDAEILSTAPLTDKQMSQLKNLEQN